MSCAPTISGASGGAAAPTSRVLDAQGNLVVANTAAESVLYSATVPAGTLVSLGDMLRLQLDGVFENQAGSRAFTLRVRLGGVLYYEASLSSIAAAAVRKPFELQVRFGLTALGPAVVTMNGWFYLISAVSNGVTTGFGTIQAGTGKQVDAEIASPDGLTPNVTAPAVVEVSVQFDLASPLLIFERRAATLEALTL